MTDQAGGTAWADDPGSPRPNVARIYDYLLGGKDHFVVDRQAAQQLIAASRSAGHATATPAGAGRLAAGGHAGRRGMEVLHVQGLSWADEGQAAV